MKLNGLKLFIILIIYKYLLFFVICLISENRDKSAWFQNKNCSKWWRLIRFKDVKSLKARGLDDILGEIDFGIKRRIESRIVSDIQDHVKDKVGKVEEAEGH